MGSLGSEVAYLVGSRLGFRVVKQELISQGDIRAGVPEMVSATIDELGLLEVRPSLKDREAYRKAENYQIRWEEAKSKNNIGY